MTYFLYTDEEVEALMKKDKKLAALIEEVGRIERIRMPDIFHALVNAIIGQQISMKAQQTIWTRMLETYGDFTPEQLQNVTVEEIQKIGISYRKANYIKDLTNSIIAGEINLQTLPLKNNEEVCQELTKIKGIGVWTAEMIMLFSLQRKDILSYDDLGIHRGLRMLYHHRTIDRKVFEKYRRRYSPYGSIASLYLWELSANHDLQIRDPGNRKKEK